jgi:hypothetical protein
MVIADFIFQGIVYGEPPVHSGGFAVKPGDKWFWKIAQHK